jgi:hypothetical protein
MRKPVLAGLLVAGAILGVIVYSSLDLASHRVEVCMEWNGRTNCKIASGSTREFATRTAITNACAEMVSGVTDTLACERANPVSVKVLK